MGKKIAMVLLAAATSFTLLLLIIRTYIGNSAAKRRGAAIVIPRAEGGVDSSGAESASSEDEEVSPTLIPLNPSESLAKTFSMDFNGDGYEDQVIAVKASGSDFITLVIGFFNPQTSVCDRQGAIATEISQARTLSCEAMDLTGSHRIALVYQGFAPNGDSVLKAFFVLTPAGNFSIKKIADFRTDGTIFVNQVERYDAYERSQANGSSYPIWTYSSDSENPSSTDQIQTCYEWSEEDSAYVQTKKTRMKGSKIAAKELAGIQDGTVSTFANFLNGLWFMSDSSEGSRYVFFNYEAREIIFYKDDTEEVYKWTHSNLRRNGIYLSATNQEIENLQRKIDISLRSSDEIHVRVQDDVRMLITESAVWDGGYKKTKPDSAAKAYSPQEEGVAASALEKFKSWRLADGSLVKFSASTYSARNGDYSDSGIYTALKISGESYLQFRSSERKDDACFSGLYQISYSEKPETGERAVFLQPCKAQSDGAFVLDQRALVLTAVAESSD